MHGVLIPLPLLAFCEVCLSQVTVLSLPLYHIGCSDQNKKDFGS
jgi:hypothetical protein